jgi:hypothetical protein
MEIHDNLEYDLFYIQRRSFILDRSVAVGKLDRILLAIYMIALLGLLMFPIAGPEFRLLGIESDKWLHFALFGAFVALWHLLFSAFGSYDDSLLANAYWLSCESNWGNSARA